MQKSNANVHYAHIQPMTPRRLAGFSLAPLDDLVFFLAPLAVENAHPAHNRVRLSEQHNKYAAVCPREISRRCCCGSLSVLQLVLVSKDAYCREVQNLPAGQAASANFTYAPLSQTPPFNHWKHPTGGYFQQRRFFPTTTISTIPTTPTVCSPTV